MPKSGDSLIATGAADCRIRTHDLEMKETTSVCTCHSNRVKRLATAPNIPNMLWSSAEDGTIRYYYYLYLIKFVKYIQIIFLCVRIIIISFYENKLLYLSLKLICCLWSRKISKANNSR